MGLSSIGQLCLHVAIPVPAPLSPGCSDATLLWGRPELGPIRISSEPANIQPEPCALLLAGTPSQGAGRGRCQGWLCLPWSPIRAVTAAFIPDVAGTAGAARHGNYSLPRPVPSRDGCFPHDRMLSKAPHPGLSRSQPQKGAGKAAGRAAGLCPPAQRCWKVPEGSERAKRHQIPLTASAGALRSQLQCGKEREPLPAPGMLLATLPPCAKGCRRQQLLRQHLGSFSLRLL